MGPPAPACISFAWENPFNCFFQLLASLRGTHLHTATAVCTLEKCTTHYSTTYRKQFRTYSALITPIPSNDKRHLALGQLGRSHSHPLTRFVVCDHFDRAPFSSTPIFTFLTYLLLEAIQTTHLPISNRQQQYAMQKVSASASRKLPSEDLRRYSYKLKSPSEDGRLPAFCRCELPARPDNWPNKAWRKYLTTMARLPCKPCGWVGGVIPSHRLVPAASTLNQKDDPVSLRNAKNQERRWMGTQANKASPAPYAFSSRGGR